MAKENQEKFQCPECDSKNIRLRFKVNTKDKNNAYANVSEEIQCGNCFMDIPANVFFLKMIMTLRIIKKFGSLFINQST